MNILLPWSFFNPSSDHPSEFISEPMKLEHAMKVIECLLPHSPERVFELLGHIRCDEQRQTLARTIAHTWARTDNITIAYNTVARSSLNATDKQVMFNEFILALPSDG